MNNVKMTCTRRSVTAHLINREWVHVGTASNGLNPLRGSCLAGDCPRGRLTTEELPSDSPYGPGEGECLSPHAEIRLLRDADPDDVRGGYLMVSTAPCHQCRVVIEDSSLAGCFWPEGFWLAGETFN